MRVIIFMLLASVFCVASAQPFSSKIIAVLDGDTVLIARGTGVLKIRLVNIDAPEKDQPFGASSQQSLAALVLHKTVQINSQAMDQYGRMVAQINVNGLDVNAEQIRRGMAWEYSHYHSNKTLIALEADAKQAPRGLWAMSNPTPPWDWRRQHPNLHTPLQSNKNLPQAGCEKKHCAQMTSCEQARHALTVCGYRYLDGDGDGVPCEKLCTPATTKQHKN